MPAPAPNARPRLLRRLAARVPPQYLVLGVFGLLLLVLKLTHPQPLNQSPMSVRYALYMMACYALAAIVGQSRNLTSRQATQRKQGLRLALDMVRAWLPFVLCLWVYENLHDTTKLIRPDTVDHLLMRADQWIFGVQPTLWLQRTLHPLLTDWFGFAYMQYFVLPFLLGGWLYYTGHTEEFREFQLGLLLTFYGGFMGYIFVPAVGPRFVLRQRYTKPLVGRFVYWHAKKVVTKLQHFARDCFPSLHTGASTTTLYFLLRHRRTVPPRLRIPVLTVWTVLTVSLWISTVYLRYHWFVDVVAGWLLTTLASAAGIWLNRHWPRLHGTTGAAQKPLPRPGSVAAPAPAGAAPTIDTSEGGDEHRGRAAS